MLAANRVDGVAGKARATQLVVHALQQAVVAARQHFGRSRGERMARSYGEHDVDCQHCPDRVPAQRVERLAISDHSASFSGRVLAQDGVGQLAFRQLDSNGTARVGGGHRGVTEIVRSLESTLRCLLRLLRRFGLSFPHP